jgi:hypothetical protein
MEPMHTIRPAKAKWISVPSLESLCDLEARMLWPHDEGARQEFIKSSRADFGVGVIDAFSDILALAPDVVDEIPGIATLARDSIPWWSIEEKAAPVFRDGFISGLILRTTLARAGSTPEAGASIQGIMKEIAGNFRRQRLGFETIRDKIWPRYRCVSHYWAAFQDAKAKNDATEFPFALHEFYAWLAEAERYRQLGERTRTFRARTPILRKGDAFIFRNHAEH